MRTLVTATLLAILLAGCGDPDQAKREALRNEVIAFRVATDNTYHRGMIILAFQKLETAIAIARADGVKLDPDAQVSIDRMLAYAQQARTGQDPDAALKLAGEVSVLEILVTEEH